MSAYLKAIDMEDEDDLEELRESSARCLAKIKVYKEPFEPYWTVGWIDFSKSTERKYCFEEDERSVPLSHILELYVICEIL